MTRELTFVKYLQWRAVKILYLFICTLFTHTFNRGSMRGGCRCDFSKVSSKVVIYSRFCGQLILRIFSTSGKAFRPFKGSAREAADKVAAAERAAAVAAGLCVCIYFNVYIFIHIHMYIHKRICMYIYICMCIYIYIYIYMCMHICMYTYIHVCMCIRISV